MADAAEHGARLDRALDALRYYRAAAEVMGWEKDKTDAEGYSREAHEPQAGYSFAWFYRHVCTPERFDEMTPQVRAFLLGGGDAARGVFEGGTQKRIEVPEDALLKNEAGIELNASQLKAIGLALNEPVSIVQGPPGTGKTETILNMVSCMLALPDSPTVAVVATNGKAIDNITEKVAAHAGCDAGSMPNWHRVCGAYARLGNKANCDAWVKRHAAEAGALGFEGGGWLPEPDARTFLAAHPFISSTIHSLAKRFADGESFRYDYVIMDEASQCGVMLGLIPMAFARHLVLVGDERQLPPVYREDLEPEIAAASEADGVSAPPGVLSPTARAGSGTEGASILEAAGRAFPFGNRVMLDEHFRCHPGIIGFCNREFYGGGLEIRTPGYGDVDEAARHPPIRVRWFDGTYAEACPPLPGKPKGDGGGAPMAAVGRLRSSRRNRRQLEVFMAEEWPLLKERLDGDDPPTFCILSPFRGQVGELKAALSRVWSDGALELGCGTDGCGDDEAGAPDPVSAYELRGIPHARGGRDVEGLTQTIHKSQGHEYDIVYFLPVDDLNWEWPWSQGGRLVNVAVSRAKRELVVIASSGLMGTAAQRGLAEAGLMPRECEVEPYASRGLGKAGAAEAADPDGRAAGRENLRYVEKLLDYVRERGAGYFPEGSGGWGFQRSGYASIFDTVSHLRQKEAPGGGRRDAERTERATERAFIEALGSVDLASRGLTVEMGARLRGLDPARGWDGALSEEGGFFSAKMKRGFIEGDGGDVEEGSHLDFAIMDARSRRLVLAVKVDGEQHRAVWHGAGDVRGASAEKRAQARIDALAVRERNDRMKDRIARDLGARVLQGNEPATWREEPDGDGRFSALPGRPAFTLLRLPTDGTTAWETEALRRERGADAAVAGRFTTLERLIDEQLEYGIDKAPAVEAGAGKEIDMDEHDKTTEAPSISKLLKAWREQDADFPIASAAQANEALAEAGLIRKEGGGWTVTEEGAKLGIESQERDFRDGGRGTICVYPEACRDAVRDALVAADPSAPLVEKDRKMRYQIIDEEGLTFGRAFDTYTTRSQHNDDGSFTNTYSKLGGLMHQLKYDGESPERIKKTIASMVSVLSPELDELKFLKGGSLIVTPMPSTIERPFDPVTNLAQQLTCEIRDKVNPRCRCLVGFLSKHSDVKAKTLELGKEFPDDAFSCDLKKINDPDPKLLIVDDIYGKGRSLRGCLRALEHAGFKGRVYFLSLVYTRSNGLTQ